MVRPTPLLRFAQAVRKSLTPKILPQQSYGYGNGYGGSGGGGGGWGGGGGAWSSHGGDRMGTLGGSLRTIDWRGTHLEKFEKNFYTEDKRVSARSDSEIEAFRRTKEIRVCYYFLGVHFMMSFEANTRLFSRCKARTSLDQSPVSMRSASLVTS